MGCSSVVKYLSSMHKDLGSILETPIYTPTHPTNIIINGWMWWCMTIMSAAQDVQELTTTLICIRRLRSAYTMTLSAQLAKCLPILCNAPSMIQATETLDVVAHICSLD